jgi:hypothetical protein
MAKKTVDYTIKIPVGWFNGCNDALHECLEEYFEYEIRKGMSLDTENQLQNEEIPVASLYKYATKSLFNSMVSSKRGEILKAITEDDGFCSEVLKDEDSFQDWLVQVYWDEIGDTPPSFSPYKGIFDEVTTLVEKAAKKEALSLLDKLEDALEKKEALNAKALKEQKEREEKEELEYKAWVLEQEDRKKRNITVTFKNAKCKEKALKILEELDVLED